MKKLLALILCVMMFVAVIPTSAFADKPTYGPFSGGPLTSIPKSYTSEKAIKNAKEDIEYMYGALTANTAVFGGIQAIDGIVGELATSLFDGVDKITNPYTGVTVTGSKAKDNTKVVLRDAIGSSIVTYMNNHRNDFVSTSTSFTNGTYKLSYTGQVNASGDPIYASTQTGYYFTTSDGGKTWKVSPANSSMRTAIAAKTTDWNTPTDPVNPSTTYKYNPEKYVKTFADAVTDTFNGKDGAAYVQSLVYNLAALKAFKDTNDSLDDLYDEILAWEDGTAILNQYHFNDTANGFGNIWHPYAMLDNAFYPNSLDVFDNIIVP